MISPEQSKNIQVVYRRLLESELNGWDKIDETLELLEWLNEEELLLEVETLQEQHKNKSLGCPYDHSEGQRCSVLDILDAVEAILELYKETCALHEKNRYILYYYLALTNLGLIVELK